MVGTSIQHSKRSLPHKQIRLFKTLQFLHYSSLPKQRRVEHPRRDGGLVSSLLYDSTSIACFHRYALYALLHSSELALTYSYLAQNYYQQMQPGPGYDGHQQSNQYYQPQHQVAGQHPGYGPVTYYTNAPATQATLGGDYESRKRGMDALDNFFGQVKNRQIDISNYQGVSQRLFELQGLQLPLITQQPVSAIPAYQPVSAMAGGDYGHGEPMQAYSLPPMGNAKTRGDLTSIDQILEQMQATIYENDHNLGQARVADPYIAYRTSQSPPGIQLQSSHAQNVMAHQHQGSIGGASDGGTPGLTPSSAHSYTSGHSPISQAGTPMQQGPTSGAMYPTLPAQSGIEYNSSNAATLGMNYDEEHRRRYSGGRLQRAAPGPKATEGSAMDVSSEGSATPPASARKLRAKAASAKAKAQQAMAIDPALGGEVQTPTSANSGEVSKEEAERQSMWVENMRLIEWMREFIKKRLDAGQYEEAENKENEDIEMKLEGGEQKVDEEKHEGLYPVLKAVEGEA